MKIMIICGFFAKENESEVLEQAKGVIEYSANVFQGKLIDGFKEVYSDVSIISAPEIGSYPNRSKLIAFKKFQNSQDVCWYVSFNNIWGFRNISRAKKIKKALHEFIKVEEQEKIIVVYSVHTPFLEAAVYAKRKDPRIKICLIIPDLPHYMNLNAHVSVIYKVGKKFDIAKFNKLNRNVDSYMLLTEAMTDMIDVHECPYCVIEGIVDSDVFKKEITRDQTCKNDGKRYIVYTGKTNEKFGVKELVDAFKTLEDSNLRLVICGKGDADQYIAQQAAEDSRILALGQVSHDEALEWIQSADVLVNPRQDNEEYTKYSFPSKNIEYLSSGKPTVGYILRGMKPIYREFMFVADEDGIAEAIMKALNSGESEMEDRVFKVREYLQSLSGKSVAERIIKTIFRYDDVL